MAKYRLGGQALIEGVMILNYSKNKLGLAVRKNKTKIITKTEKLKIKPNNIPLIRGIINFILILYIGIKSLNFSTNVAVDKEDEGMGFWSILFSFIFAIFFGLAIFKFLPLLFASSVDKIFEVNNVLFSIIDGVIKIAIFVLYVYLISLMKDVYRVFQYHAAEHMTIACYEAGEKLTLKNIKKYNKEHKRCGTSFIFLVLIVSIIAYTFIPKDYSIGLKFLWRIILLPFVAAISYEILKYGAEYKVIGWLSYPGILLQKITTKKTKNDMIEVAIKAVKAAI